MRILIVAQYFWPENFRINDLASFLRIEHGYDITVLTGMPNYPEGHFFDGYTVRGPYKESWQGINIVRVPIVSRGKDSKMRLALNYLSFALCASLLGVWKCRGRYDLIFVAQYSPVTVAIPAIFLKYLKRVPMFLWVQDLWPESLSATGAVHSAMILNIVGRIVSFIYRNSDKILVQSQAFIPHIKELCAQNKSIEYLPNWAEEIYQPCASDFSWGINNGLPEGFRVMFAGNIGAAQDFPTILSAAEQLKEYEDIQWIILGDGRVKEWVDQEIQNRKLTRVVHLMGRHPVEEMPRYFALADALLVTLKSEPIFSLTVPSKVQSYLACSRPILAALEGEGRRVIEEARAGLTCKPESPGELAGIVLRMRNMDPMERESMGIQGRRYYEAQYERTQVIEKLVSFCKSETLKE